VLLCVEPRQMQEPPPVMARLDDLRVEDEPHLVAARHELDLVDVEPELVQAAEPLLELAAFADAERLVARQLVPEPVVRPADARCELERVGDDLAAELCGEILELAGE